MEPVKEAAVAPVLRPMLATDLPAVMEIDAESLPRPWSAALWREELKSPFASYMVLEDGGEVVAHLGTKIVADELHVMTLAVRPRYRRRGYARAMISAAIAASPEARYVHLEVRPGNTAARALYESMGFVVTGLRPRYYGDEDAVLMTLTL